MSSRRNNYFLNWNENRQSDLKKAPFLSVVYANCIVQKIQHALRLNIVKRFK